MEKELYYVVEQEVTGDDLIGLFATGNKNVTVYEIVGGKPKSWFSLDIDSGENSEESIQEWLDDNGYGDETFNLNRL